jgi:beta propeller repeat protein
MFFLMAAAMIVKADLTPFSVCDYSSAQYTPAIDGSLVAWVDERTGTNNKHIYVKVLPGGTEQEICTVLGNQTSPAVSGSVIVWQDSRKGNGDDDIYAYDMNAGQAIAVCTDTYNQQFPDISGRIVVWQEYNGSNWDIYGINLDGGGKFIICDNPANQTYPAISGHYVVWQDYRNGGSDIYCRDLNAPAGSEFLICGAPGDQFYPDIDGNLIVWQDPRDLATTNMDIYAYELGGRGEFQVCVHNERQGVPAVSGDWIIWRDRRDDSTTSYDIYGYNRGTETEMKICTASGKQDNPAVSQHYVVWQDTTLGDIYGAAFPVAAAITVIDPNGGETWIAGSQRQIQWQSQGAVSTVKIEISANNGTNWQTIVNNIANTGVYDIDVPTDIHSQQCLIRVSDTASPTVKDQSDAVFTIFQCSLTADLTGDCFVGLDDFALFATQWLQCGNPFDPTWCQNP